MEERIAKQRELWIDSVKGIGILLVILLHTCGMPSINGISLTPGVIPVFFVAAGLTYKYCGLKIDIIKKAKRLLIPYFIFGGVIIALVTLIIGDFGHAPLRCLGLCYGRYYLYNYDTPNNVTLMMETAPLWFLLAMFVSYVWLSIIKTIQNRFCRWINIILSICFVIACRHLPILLPWSIDTAFIFAIFISFGVFLRSKLLWYSCQPNIIKCILLALVLGLFVALRINNGAINISIRQYGMNEDLSVLIFVLLGFLESIVVCGLCLSIKDTMVEVIFTRVGRQSMRMLCLHYPIIIFAPVFFDVDVHSVAFGLSLCAVSFVMAVLIDKITKII